MNESGSFGCASSDSFDNAIDNSRWVLPLHCKAIMIEPVLGKDVAKLLKFEAA